VHKLLASDYFISGMIAYISSFTLVNFTYLIKSVWASPVSADSLEQENNYLRSVLNVAGNTSPPNQPTHDSVQRQASQPNASLQPENYYKSIAAHGNVTLYDLCLAQPFCTSAVWDPDGVRIWKLFGTGLFIRMVYELQSLV